jgi:putative ABC transport system permease protein
VLFKLAIKSIWYRRGTLALTLVAIITSIALLIGIEHIQQQAKKNFSRTLSGTDLIVGARGGSTNLLLYSVFHIGNATANISWNTYLELKKHQDVDWLIPISLGDSHRGYRVIGTEDSFFSHYQYGKQQSIQLIDGTKFSDYNQVVIGADVAKKLHYKINDSLVLSHGTGKANLYQHTDKPFKVVGILQTTGTPIDKSLLVSLEAIEAIHLNWQSGVPLSSSDTVNTSTLTPKTITAILVGLKSKQQTFKVQRQINQYKAEALTAIMPGVALAELWQMLGSFEKILSLIAHLVLITSLISVSSCLLAGLNERTKEMAVLRSLGAGPFYLFCLIELEIILLTVTGFIGAIILLTLFLWSSEEFLMQYFSIQVDWFIGQSIEYSTLLIILLSAVILGLIPAGVNGFRHLGKGLI